MTQKVKSRSKSGFPAIYFPGLARKKNCGKDLCFAVLFSVFLRVSRVKSIIILALFSSLVGFAGAAELYYTNRTYSSVEFNIQGEPTAIILYTNALRLTNIVRGAAITTNLAATRALEREAFTVGYLSAMDAWDDAVAYYTNTASLNHPGKVFDNVGWVRGANLARGEWGAYLWTMQNQIAFRTSTTDWWKVTSTGAPVQITNVIVGSLGIYGPMSNVVDVGPSLEAATNNFPAQAEAREFYADLTNVFYVLMIPHIWITPWEAVRCVGDSNNVQYMVTGTNIPQGVTWSLIPNLSGSGGAAFQSEGAWQATVMPGTVATNYKVRATSKDNTNFSAQADLTVLKVDIVETNFYLCANSMATLHLTPDSSANVRWEIIPSLQNGAFIQGSSVGTSIVINAGSIPTNYTVRAYAVDLTNCYDTCTVNVLKVDIMETNVYVIVTNITTLHLTPDSSTNVQWEISPTIQTGAYIVGNSIGTSIVINAGSIPTNYTVKAYAVDLTNCFDTCKVSVIKIEKIPLGDSTNLSKNIIGKVYIPTKWGGPHMLYGSNVYIQFFYMNGMDLDMETAIKIAKGELDGNRVAQGDPCLYEVPFGKFGWYYAKITDETEQTVSSTFHEHGEVPRPWQGYFWPTKPDHAGPNLYDDGYALDKYDTVYGTTAQEWEAANHTSGVSWGGHCRGTAIASVLTNQPAATISTNNVSFSQEDMEGLYIELADNPAHVYEDYSVTNIPASPVSAATGEAIDSYCDDFHNALVKTLIDRKEPLVGNLRDEYGQNSTQVWNHAVYKSSFRMMQAAGQDDEKVILVYTTIHSPVTESYPSSGTEDRVDIYKYEVKYDTNGEIDGTYPDQNWREASGFPPANIFRVKYSDWLSQNPEVSLARVNQLYGY